MADRPRDRLLFNPNRAKQIGPDLFEVRAVSRQRALEMGSTVFDVSAAEVHARPVRERELGVPADNRSRVRRYRVSLRPIDGSFRLTIGGANVYLQVEPPQYGGRPVVAEQVLQELERWPVADVNRANVEKAIAWADRSRLFVAELALPKDAPTRGIVVLVTADQMRAYAVARGQTAKPPIDRKGLEQALARAGVVAGVLHDQVYGLLVAKHRDWPVLVARGQAPVPGQSATLEWLVPIVPGGQRESIPPVVAGQPLARLKPPEPGRPGFTVTGQAIATSADATVELGRLAGHGVEIAADGQVLLAAAAGKPVLQGEQVAVLPVEEVEALAGSRSVAGSLVVRGAIAAGSHLRATGHIEVAAMLAGTTVHAGGSILVDGAAASAWLTAGQDVVAHFLSDCVVKAEGAVRIGTEVVHGLVWAGQRVVVAGPGGIDRGLVRAGQEIVTEAIGNADGRRTRVVVGDQSSDRPSRIVVRRAVLPGTIVRIGRAELAIGEPLGPTIFELDNGQIVARPMAGDSSSQR